MNAYDIEIEYDEENDNYYAEHEFSYPSKRVRLNIDTENSLWPTDEDNEMTITIPSNPQTDSNNTWDDTTKTLTLTNLDQNTLITNNQNPSFNYATDLNINLSNYQSSSTKTKTNIYMQYSYISYLQNHGRNESTSVSLSNYTFTKANGYTSITIPTNSLLIIISRQLNDYYKIYFKINSSNSSMNSGASMNEEYVIIGSINTFLHLCETINVNDKGIVILQDDVGGDVSSGIIYLNKNEYNLHLTENENN